MKQASLILALCGIFTSIGQAQTTLISESFGGLDTDTLNGTTADVFASTITTAGGSNAWVAGSLYRADGSINGGSSADDQAAFLDLGTFIDDAKGTEAGIFTIEATITVPTTGTWTSIGFFDGNQLINENFTTNDSGIATAILRDSTDDAFAYFAGPDTANPSGDIAFSDSSISFSIVLDLSSYDGTTDFGSVAYYHDGGASPDFTHAYTSANTFSQIGFSLNNGGGSNLSDFTLTQATIPEPSAFALYGGLLSLGVLLLRRKHRQTV